MRQSTLVFAILLFAFLVYITGRGQLPQYLLLFKRKDQQTATINNSSSSGGSPLDAVFGNGSTEEAAKLALEFM